MVYTLEEAAKHSGRLALGVVGMLGEIVRVASTLADLAPVMLVISDYVRVPTPSDGDNNDVIGG